MRLPSSVSATHRFTEDEAREVEYAALGPDPRRELTRADFRKFMLDAVRKQITEARSEREQERERDQAEHDEDVGF